MFILLNGSFGIGKKSPWRTYWRVVILERSYHPERIGFALRRLLTWMLGLAQQPPDYQEPAIWRRVITRGARRKHGRLPVVIVQMAFANSAYLDGVAQSLSTGAPAHRLCLTSSFDVARFDSTQAATRANAGERYDNILDVLGRRVAKGQKASS